MGKKTYWKQTIQNASNDQDMTTKSNEAFALLLLENQWDRWLDIITLNDGKMTSRRGQKRAMSESKVMPKYTRGGITYAGGNREDGQKGWCKEGILQFNAGEITILVPTFEINNPVTYADNPGTSIYTILVIQAL